MNESSRLGDVILDLYKAKYPYMICEYVRFVNIKCWLYDIFVASI